MAHRCRFVDMDGTVFKANSDEWLPGVREKLEEWHRAGDHLVAFTMRPPGPWMEKVQPYFKGYFQKPCAEEYYVYDDHLVEGHQSIACPHKDRRPHKGRLYCFDCKIYLHPDEDRRTKPCPCVPTNPPAPQEASE